VLVNLVFELFDDELVVINEGCFLVLDLCGELVCYVNVCVCYLDCDGIECIEVKCGIIVGIF